MDLIKTIIGCSMEAERVPVNPGEISAWFDPLSSIVDDIPREFVFSMDKTGCSDYIDSREGRVIAQIAHPGPSIAVPDDQDRKLSIFVARIAADGFRMKLFVIIPRVTAEKALKYYGPGRTRYWASKQMRS